MNDDNQAELTDGEREHGNGGMDRVTVRISNAMLLALDGLIEQGIYLNRSEAIRDALRERMTVTDGRQSTDDTERFVYDEPCDWSRGGEPRCGERPTAPVGDIYYTCEDHYGQFSEWLNRSFEGGDHDV